MLTSFYKLARTSTRQDITTCQSRCFLNSRALSNHLFRRMFSQAQACANIILQVSSYQYQAGRTLQYFSQDIFLTAEYCPISCIEECSPKHRHVLTSFYKLAHTSTRQDITTFQSRYFSQQHSIVPPVVWKNVLPSTGMC